MLRYHLGFRNYVISGTEIEIASIEQISMLHIVGTLHFQHDKKG